MYKLTWLHTVDWLSTIFDIAVAQSGNDLFTFIFCLSDCVPTKCSPNFSTLLDATNQDVERDQMLERLLLWISNCVQLLLFLKHTFQLPELSTPEIRPMRRCSINSPRNEHTLKQPSPRKEDSAKHALAQLVTGLEEIIMFCFQQSVYTITKVSLMGTDLSSRETTLSKLFLSSFEKVYSIRKEFVPSYKFFFREQNACGR